MKTLNAAQLRRQHIAKLNDLQRLLFALGIFTVKVKVVSPLSYRISHPVIFWNPLTWLTALAVFVALVWCNVMQAVSETHQTLRTDTKTINLYSNNTML